MKQLTLIINLILVFLMNTTAQDRDKINIIENLKFQGGVDRLSDNINSEYPELYPVISPNGETLYFTRKIPKSGRLDADIFFSTADAQGIWQKAVSIGSGINDVQFNSAITSPNSNNLMLYFNHTGTIGLESTRKTGDNWTETEIVYQRKAIAGAHHVNLFIGNDLKTIVMNGFDGIDDLMMVRRLEDEWTEPVSLGDDINTADDENVSFLAADNITLYFSSRGHSGFGGSDLFMTRRLDNSWQSWSEPVNLGPEINSPQDDDALFIPASAEYVYFTRSTPDKETDLFRIQLPDELKPNPVVIIKGIVSNSKTNQPIGTDIFYRDLATDEDIGYSHSDEIDGSYEVILPIGKKYSYFATLKKFYPISENIDLKSVDEYKEITEDLLLAPIEEGVSITLNNLFFDVNSSVLHNESIPELNRLVQTVRLYPDMKIEVSGHTDSVGDEGSNLRLSENRAKSVSKFLVENKIATSRIETIGYGESKPIADNSTEEGRRINRRVEFQILSK
ncbi:OmpA family protein [Bacteroidota bacterium]